MSGLLALLDDVATIAKVAAASLDDVIGQSAKAGLKAAGAVIDDAAVTPKYVHGFSADRELPIVGRIALGSIRNKMLILLPAALLLSAFAPQVIAPLLMLGGAYLCFEGAEKVYHLVVHPAHGNWSGTLVNALLYHCQQLPGKQEIRPGLVHRIDKDTSGILVVAKSEFALTYLAKQFFDHTIERRYRALVWGDFEEEEGTIEGHIGRHERNAKMFTVYEDGEYGKHAITHYRVIQRFGYVTLVECQLETGRTHQIRVHMKHIGHPLFNDKLYGGDKIVKGTIFTKYKEFIDNCFKLLPHQALHAFSLGFQHPSKDEKIYLEAGMPEYFKATLEKWEKYTEGRLSK